MVQNQSAGGRGEIGERATDGEWGVADNGTEPGTHLREVSSCVVAGGMVRLGGQRHPVAFAVEDLRYRRTAGVWDR
jgi:hypothetical protein